MLLGQELAETTEVTSLNVPVISTGPSPEAQGKASGSTRAFSIDSLVKKLETANRDEAVTEEEGAPTREQVTDVEVVTTRPSPVSEATSVAKTPAPEGGAGEAASSEMDYEVPLPGLEALEPSNLSAVGVALGGRSESVESPRTTAVEANERNNDEERWAAAGLGEAGSEDVVDEEPASVEPGYGGVRQETWNNGYFPTRSDSYYLGDVDYPRSNYVDPDVRSLTATGLFPYEDPDVSFYERYPGIFRPIDRGLGMFTTHEGLVLEGERFDQFSIGLDSNMPMFTRMYDPNRAHIKAGPLFFDLMSLGGGILYSDYDGPEVFAPGEEDGWLSFLELQMRVALRISDSLFINASARLIYLPGTNEVGLLPGIGFGPHGVAFINYQAEWGEWDIRLYDEFRGYIGGDLFYIDDAYERRGRYSFGFPDTTTDRDFFDGDYVTWANQIGVEASRPIGYDWRLWLEADHSDYWRDYHFTDHTHREHIGALLGYNGSVIPFAPYFRYDGDSTDHFDSMYHRVYVGGRGRLTENVRIDGRTGYLWSQGRDPDQDSWLWDLGLTHDISERAWHSIRGGQDYFTDDFSDESALANYLRYDFNYRFTRELYGTAFAQWSEDEILSDSSRGFKRLRVGGEQDRELYGARLSFRPGRYTLVTTGAAFERTHFTETDGVLERDIYHARLSQQISSRVNLWFRYQFEDTTLFDEHLYSAGIRRYF